MDANTIEILKECNKGCKMAVESIGQVLPKVSGEELKTLLEKYMNSHKELENESSKLIMEAGEKESNPGMMASTFSWISTEMKLRMDGDDRKIAKIMMDGCNMGIQSVSEYINKYQDAAKESMELAKKLVKLEEDMMKELEQFV